MYINTEFKYLSPSLSTDKSNSYAQWTNGFLFLQMDGYFLHLRILLKIALSCLNF